MKNKKSFKFDSEGKMKSFMCEKQINNDKEYNVVIFGLRNNPQLIGFKCFLINATPLKSF